MVSALEHDLVADDTGNCRNSTAQATGHAVDVFDDMIKAMQPPSSPATLFWGVSSCAKMSNASLKREFFSL